jgi:hypothetical protein
MRSVAKWLLLAVVIWAVGSWGATQIGSGEVTLKSLITGAAGQLDVALQQALLSSAAPTPDNAEWLNHQLINLLEGRSGADYDPKYAMAGDELGLIDYAGQIKTGLQDPGYAHRFDITIDNVISYFNLGLDHARRAVALSNLPDIQKEMNQVTAFLSAAKGRTDDVAPLGGILLLKAQITQP